MLILFDHGTPKGLIRVLPGRTVITAQSRGWERLNNGALLNAAEEAALDLLLTTDRTIRYQQNLAGRKIALVVFTGTTKWSRVRLHLERVATVVNAATPLVTQRWKFRSIRATPSGMSTIRSDAGGERAAAIYSLLGSAKLNDPDPGLIR